MTTMGSVLREDAARQFDFLAAKFPARRAAIRQFTHRDPDFVFWISPDGLLYHALDSHLKNPPEGFEHIVHDEPDYGGFLRGRVASLLEDQLIVVYCREEALAENGNQLTQFLSGIEQIPIYIGDETLVISDNGDIYGTLGDLFARQSIET